MEALGSGAGSGPHGVHRSTSRHGAVSSLNGNRSTGTASSSTTRVLSPRHPGHRPMSFTSASRQNCGAGHFATGTTTWAVTAGSLYVPGVQPQSGGSLPPAAHQQRSTRRAGQRAHVRRRARPPVGQPHRSAHRCSRRFLPLSRPHNPRALLHTRDPRRQKRRHFTPAQQRRLRHVTGTHLRVGCRALDHKPLHSHPHHLRQRHPPRGGSLTPPLQRPLINPQPKPHNHHPNPYTQPYAQCTHNRTHNRTYREGNPKISLGL